MRSFNSGIEPMVQRIQGSSEYKGTVPSRETNVFLKLNMK